jgi:HlyD family secretion protein
MKRAIIVLLIIAAIGAGAGAYYVTHSGTEMNVVTAPITGGDVIDAVVSTGILQPVISVTVGSRVSGNIDWLGADFNSIVKKGQVIAKLDPVLFQAQVDQAAASLGNNKAQLNKDEANLAYQRLTYTRDQDLVKAGIATQDALDAAKSAADQAAAQVELDKAAIVSAQAQLDQSKTNLEFSVITSPIDGIVTQRSVDIGQTVQASMTAPTIFVIAEDLTKMQVSANIDESDVGRIVPGQEVTFRVDAYPGAEFRGTVAQIRLNPAVVNNVTTYSTMINVPNNDFRLKPGMTANLRVQIAKRTGVLRVPNAALRFRPSLDAFTALNQAVPPEALPGGRGRGRGARATANAAGGADAASGGPGGPNRSASNAAGPTSTGGGGAGGRGGSGGDQADRQARMMDRFKSMSPDEQKQFIARMKDRGQDTAPFEKVMSGGKGSAKPKDAPPKFVYVSRYGSQDGQTIDSLFTPLPAADGPGRVWVFMDHQLKPVNLRLGITDGTFTELLSGELQENMEVVTGISGLGSTRTVAAAGGGNPLIPQRGGGPGGGPGRGR